MSYTHLQVRSGYSFFNSTITIEKLVQRASELNFDAIALTDENALYGTIPFYKACKEKGIKPIIGMIIQIEDKEDNQEQCVLLAKNNTGYQSLIKISTWIQQQDQETIDAEMLQNLAQDVVAIFTLSNSTFRTRMETETFEQLQSYIKNWESLFEKEDFYLGIQNIRISNDEKMHSTLKDLNERAGVAVTAIHDVRYLNAQDDIVFDCLQSMKNGESWEVSQNGAGNSERYLTSSEEMENSFHPFWPEVLLETEAIKQKCNVSIQFGKPLLPSFPVPDHTDAQTYLEAKCFENLNKKYNPVTEEVKNRLEVELRIIAEMGFSDYFLIVADFIQYAKANRIMVGPGRGSAAGSLVAYLLEIIDVDPIKYNLLFERFLNPERRTMPDIDIDFSDTRRDEVIEYVRDKYGDDHVAQIITFGTFAARSILREVMKTMEIDQQDTAYILKHIPLQAKLPIPELVKQSAELVSYIKQSPQLKTLFSIAARLEGLPRHVSTHAAGVVISEEALVEHIPLRPGTGTTMLTQFPMNELEELGLLKIDLLGLRNLSLIERVVRNIHFSYKKQVDVHNLEQGDDKTFSLLRQGKTNGVFQLESQGMQQVLRNLQPTSFEDIVAVNALYRPGPMEYIPTYIKRKSNNEQISYPHPDLEPILANTYGVLVYQEQIMQIANKIAGMSLGEADVLRRAISKKQEHVLQEQKEIFVQGCLQHGYDKAVGEEIFAWIVRFANYGFNRSHAVAYSIISYQLAFLKAHYPAAFFTELLSSVANQQEKMHQYIQEIKELGIQLAAPSINFSYGRFSVEGSGIRMGLSSIKGVGNQVVQEIIRVRKDAPFKDLFDFCLRVSHKMVNRKTLELLIMAGAFDETKDNRASLLASIDRALEQGELFKEFQDQPSLFQDKIELEADYVEIEDFSPLKKLSDEKDLLGIYISSHPLHAYRDSLRRNGNLSISAALALETKKEIQCTVMIQRIKTIRTKRGENMAFLTLNDETGDMDAVAFPELYRNTRKLIEEENVVMVKGRVEERNGTKQLLLSNLTPFEEAVLEKTEKEERLFIRTTGEENEEDLKAIREIVKEHPGAVPIIVFRQKQRKSYKLDSEYFVDPSYKCLQALKQYFGEENIVLDKSVK
ncbi:DNA polymerase III subunit alpha [Oceanobacillus picturae]|uniref:DNA polymerase III subunit alpha n=1 Tax=Oceanobacillus picturae TaxID=171693 RepID=UPI000E680FA8|nr:DNA polymerase III subunit alpha [Oceanobacillus picturae]RIU89738.1 DNA polymerase III subunit alpha [Oceanobacillus picturae]